jgi:hypothetical protein
MRILSFVLAMGALGGTGVLLVGCPANSCFLKICDGKNCRCSISSCGEGAAFDTRQNRCRCLVGHFTIGGQCLTQDQANAYCGRAHHWDGRGCARDTCRAGDELDETTGMCIAHDQVAQVGASMGVPVGQGQKLGCPAGQKLILDGNTAACVPLSQTCAPDETWTGNACVKVASCPNGSAWDPQRAQCIQYAQGGGGELTVNPSEWAAANYGPPGGQGTPAFCGAFSKKPYSFGINSGNSATVRVTINMSFPGNEVAKGVVQTISAFDASGNPVPARGAADIDASAQRVFLPLAMGGGRASSPSATTTVKCVVTNASKPQPVPVGGL